MFNPSNLYAEKVFSEHPTGLWSLDDSADYISLYSDSKANVFTWNVDGGIVSEFTNFLGAPFSDSSVTKILPDLPTTGYGEILLLGNETLSLATLNKQLSTFSISTYIYSKTPYIDHVTIGYRYLDSRSGSYIYVSKKYETNISENWFFISETFSNLDFSLEVEPFIQIGYIVVQGTHPSEYEFYQNGLSIGQWSENFHASSLGVTPIPFPSDINLDNCDSVIPAKAYGLLQDDGYYIVNNGNLVAKNVGIPMVFGASNLTKIEPNSGNPSLIIPGNGFLNNVGKYKVQTLEFWINVHSSDANYSRIVGPIASDDGIYINGSFILLKINDNISSHYIGKWERPMLIDLIMGNNIASLMINGEKVIELTFLNESLSFPQEFVNGKSQDWIGFYAHDDVPQLELDCVAIYPYQVSSVLAKRRFVYGQGVEFPENINNAYSGTSVYVDYPFAEYANNYSYPDLGKWSQGFIDNLQVKNGILGLRSYSDPQINLSSGNVQDILDAAETQPRFITFRPNENWQSVQGNIFIDNFNLLGSNTNSVYGIFKRKSSQTNVETLIRIDNETTGQYFSIDIVNDSIKYSLSNEEIWHSDPIELNSYFVVGINISEFTNYFGGNVSKFFSNMSALSLSIAGTKNLTNTFTGEIYNVSLCSSRNLSDNSGELFDNGIVNNDAIAYFMSHDSSYRVLMLNSFGKNKLGVAINGYWEDNIPLTYFAKNTPDINGKQKYDLDFIQFNIDYPASTSFVETTTSGSWTYGQLNAAYGNPIQRTYDSLDNSLFTGYENYEDLKNNVVKTLTYDTSKSDVKTYITFQYTVTGANSPKSYFTDVVPLSSNGVVHPGPNWMTTMYEVVDGTVIYLPKGIDFKKLSLVTHINISVTNIDEKPFKVKSLQYASQAISEGGNNKIGTRFGTPIYPYTKNGIYYNYKSENPYTIYKGSSPHLYLTGDSGLQLRGDYDPLINRGLLIPINQNQTANYKVMAMQMYLRYNQKSFSASPVEIFEIESKSGILKFFMEANSTSGNRAKIYVINTSTGKIEDGVTFYWNGQLVKEPVLSIREWGLLGISFGNVLNFIDFAGSIKINGPILFNNISYYQSTNLQEVQKVTSRPWFRTKYSGALTLDWNYWADAFLWKGVLVLASTSYYGVNPADVYKAFTGTNKIIIEDDMIFAFGGYQYSMYQDVVWQSQIQNPV